MRLPILRILIAREVRRLQKNPTALMLIGLLAAVALLMATSRPVAQQTGPTKAPRIWLTYDHRAPWIEHVVENLPSSPKIIAGPREDVTGADRFGANRPLTYPAGDHGVEILLGTDRNNDPVIQVVGRFSGDDPTVLQPFWNWFWPTATSAFMQGARFEQHLVPVRQTPQSAVQKLQQTSVAEFVTPELIGAVLLLIVQFFACCHLLVSFTSQDRERGTLMALTLSPATASEIMTAKFAFHLGLSIAGCVAIVAILQPAALLQPTLWTVLLLTSLGLMSVGTCISTFARTQAAAGLLALCYMLAGAVLFYLSTKFSAFALLRQGVFENYSFPLLYQSLKSPLPLATVVLHVGRMSAIVAAWFVLARTSFVRFGWK
ncbi:MAG: hypothetical protein ACYTGL_12155 [Planctomycetota bacterium]